MMELEDNIEKNTKILHKEREKSSKLYKWCLKNPMP